MPITPISAAPEKRHTISIQYVPSKKNGSQLLLVNGVRYFRNRRRGGKQYWKCSHYYLADKCPSIIILNEDTTDMKMLHAHNHAVDAVRAVP